VIPNIHFIGGHEYDLWRPGLSWYSDSCRKFRNVRRGMRPWASVQFISSIWGALYALSAWLANLCATIGLSVWTRATQIIRWFSSDVFLYYCLFTYFAWFVFFEHLNSFRNENLWLLFRRCCNHRLKWWLWNHGFCRGWTEHHWWEENFTLTHLFHDWHLRKTFLWILPSINLVSDRSCVSQSRLRFWTFISFIYCCRSNCLKRPNSGQFR